MTGVSAISRTGFVAALSATLCFALPAIAAPNRLAKSTSRYLQQHATNPVDWYPWGDEAFAKAKKEDKPIFLSVGYSTCHWCHVMEQESFADPETAKLMNEAFVSIKVDREERPDLDSVYLAVTRTLTGDAGWPNNVVLTPDGKPFFAASYIPRDRFRVLIPRLQAMWAEQRERVTASAEMITASLSAPPVAADGSVKSEATLRRGYEQLAARFDEKHGGFLPEPKFPAPHQLMFLLRYAHRSGEARPREMAEATLQGMRNGPLWDRIDFGFHRYSGNADWSEPHYEKMLYDQALLTLAYVEAWQVTGNDLYAQTAREIVTFVLRELRAPSGAFYAALDANERYSTAKDRTKVPRPGRDEKILSDWNGLMIAALAYGSVVLGEPSWAKAAERAAGAVYSTRRPFLDDHAFLIWGLLNLYEATFTLQHLERAIHLMGESLRLFRDDEGRFYITAGEAPKLLVRPRETGDGAIPSGTSVQMMNLVRLARITAKPEYEKYAGELLRSVGDEVSLAPSTAAHLLSALDFHLGPSYEIVLSGSDVRALQQAAFRPFQPNKVVLHRPPGERPAVVTIAPYALEQRPLGGKATAYVCTNFLCRLPVTDPAKVWKR